MKGISQIISSVMLLAIALSIAGIYSQWAPELSKDLTEKATDQSNTQVKCDNAGINLRNARHDITGNLTEFELENTGTISFYDDLSVLATNESQIVSSKTVEELEVSESLEIDLLSPEIPNRLIVSSKDCPYLKLRTEQINVTN